MALEFVPRGSVSGTGADVDADKQLLIKLNSDPAKSGAVVVYAQNDDGSITGTPYNREPEVDEDYRWRMAIDTILDQDTFYAAAQNTGKHRYGNTTMTITFGTGGATTNGAGVTTTGTGCEIKTYAAFPVYSSTHLYVETMCAFTAQPTLNVIHEWGAGLTAGAGVAAPSDGAFFRLASDGLKLVVSFNGSESVEPAPIVWTYTNNQALKTVVSITNREVEFWIDDARIGAVPVPEAAGTAFSSGSLQWFFQQRHPGTAGAVMQGKLYSYNVSMGGAMQVADFDDIGNLIHGSYQGLTGGTMGSLTGGTVTTGTLVNPTAAVPTNTTAALGTGLGGQFWETDTLAVNTDGIISSYQVPAGTISLPGRRLVIKGVWIDSFVQTTLTGGGYNAVFTLCFGHTAVSLQTAEAATTKAPRRIVLGTHSVAAAAAALTTLQRIYVPFTRPVVVNPGEFVQVVKKKVGTAPSAGVIAHNIGFDYGWV